MGNYQVLFFLFHFSAILMRWLYFCFFFISLIANGCLFLFLGRAGVRNACAGIRRVRDVIACCDVPDCEIHMRLCCESDGSV